MFVHRPREGITIYKTQKGGEYEAVKIEKGIFGEK